MTVTDLDQIKTLDRRVWSIEYTNGIFGENNLVKTKDYSNYNTVRSNKIIGKLLDSQTTDKELLEFLVLELNPLFDLTHIKFLRKERTTGGKFNGYYGVDIDIGFKTSPQTKLNMKDWEKQIDDVISKCNRKFNLTISKTKDLRLLNEYVKNTRRFFINYRCFQRRNSPIADVQKYLELFEDRFCDFDEDFKTQTQFNIIKSQSADDLIVKISFELNHRPNIENKTRFVSAINWIEKVIKMKGNILYGTLGKRTSITIQFKNSH